MGYAVWVKLGEGRDAAMPSASDAEVISAARQDAQSANGRLRVLEGGDVFGLGAFLALADLECHFLSILEGDAAGCGLVDLSEVDEDVAVSVVGLDKAVAFFVVEPFDGSILQFCHGVVPL